MPSKTGPKPSKARKSATADIDDYLLDGDLDGDNPLRSPSPRLDKDKRKEASGLGIDEEVEVQKRVRVPRVKLDEARLLSESGIPKLRQRAKHLKLKGKGHEWSDAARLLSFYQIWLDDMFPKAKFLDALAMVEKVGHKGTMHKSRMQWIDELKPRSTVVEDDDRIDGLGQENRPREPTRIAPIFENMAASRKSAGDRPRTPPPLDDDLFDDEDIYNATPRAKTANAVGGGEPDEDDLDALMAEAEAQTHQSITKPTGSIFGGGGSASSLVGGQSKMGQPASIPAAANEPDEDDLDALMAEVEEAQGESQTSRMAATQAASSIFGGAKPLPAPEPAVDDDDLDALMAEAEAGGEPVKPLAATADVAKPGPGDSFADDEEAMAEMEGLW